MSIDYKATTPQQLIENMNAVLSGNNQLIQSASGYLRVYVKHIESLPKLTDILLNSENEQLRLFSTILLKRSIVTHFQNMTPEDQEQFKIMLLTKFNSQKSFLIQKNVASLIGKLIPIIDLQNWKDLQTVFEQSIQSAPDSKSTLVLLNQLIGEFKLPQQIVDYMLKCLHHENLSQFALNCLNSYIHNENGVNEEIPKAIIEAWNIGKWSQDNVLTAIEIFSEIALKKTQLSPEIIQWIVQKTVKNNNAPQPVRVSGLDFLKQLSENQYKNKILNSNDQLLQYVIESVCYIVCIPPKVKEEEEEDGEAIEDIALWSLESFAENIKQKKFYPIIFDIIMKLIDSNEVNKMNAGFLILGSISKPCAERLKKQLPNPIMNRLIPKGLQHPAHEVRGATISALIYFSEYLVPNIIDYHNVIVPSMIRFMNDSIEKVGEHALIALEVLFENMQQDQIIKYLPDIVPILSKLWSSPNASLLMKKAALGTIGSLINASQEKFEPYIESAYALAVDSMKLPDNTEGIYLKAEGITIFGRLAFHFTKDGYKNKKDFFTNKIYPLLEPLYTTLVNTKDPNLRQGCFTFFYLLATSIGNQFSVIFDKIIVEVIKACEHDPSVPSKTGFSLDEDSEPDDGYRVVNVKIPELDEKASAIHALGALANACPLQFLPYFEKAYRILEDHNQHFNDNIRIQCINAYQNLTLALIKSKYEGKIPEYKSGLPCLQRYPQALEDHFFQELIPRLVFLMTEQTSADVSACAIETLETLIREVGPALIDKSNDTISEAIISLLEGKDKFIDQDEDENEQQDNEDDGQTNEIVFSPLCDLIPTMAKVLQIGFEPNFKAIFPSMMKYMNAERENINDNIDIVGAFSQIFHELPSVIPQFQKQVLTQINQLREIGDEELNRNICYCLGVMYEGSSQTMAPFLDTGINEIKSLYENSISPATKQNALAAIARIIITYNPQQLPLEILLATMIDTMPFKADESQQKTIWRLIIHLSNSNGDVLRPHLKKILTLLENDLKEAKKYHINKEPINSQLIQFGTNLNTLVQNN